MISQKSTLRTYEIVKIQKKSNTTWKKLHNENPRLLKNFENLSTDSKKF